MGKRPLIEELQKAEDRIRESLNRQVRTLSREEVAKIEAGKVPAKKRRSDYRRHAYT